MTPDEMAKLEKRPELDWIKDELEYLLIEFDGVVLNEKVEEVIAKWIMDREAAKDRRIAELEGALSKYGRHFRECKFNQYPNWSADTLAGKCTCGFEQSLSGKGGK